MQLLIKAVHKFGWDLWRDFGDGLSVIFRVYSNLDLEKAVGFLDFCFCPKT